jgi:plastocyanin
MARLLRILPVVVTGLLLTGCLSSEPKVAEASQVTADQRAALEATESASGGSEAPGGGTEWVASDIQYDQAPTELPAGGVTVSLQNNGAIEHDVVFEELDDQRILDAAPGESDTADIELEPGEYTYYCDVPGHRAAGMEGTVTVSG